RASSLPVPWGLLRHTGRGTGLAAADCRPELAECHCTRGGQSLSERLRTERHAGHRWPDAAGRSHAAGPGRCLAGRRSAYPRDSATVTAGIGQLIDFKGIDRGVAELFRAFPVRALSDTLRCRPERPGATGPSRPDVKRSYELSGVQT